MRYRRVLGPLTAGTERERASALERFRLLRSHLEDGEPMSRLACQQGIGLRTDRRWLRRYWAQGLAGLARTPRVERGKFAFPPVEQRPEDAPLTFSELVGSARESAGPDSSPRRSAVKLLIVDEADRLKLPEPEVLHDLFDRAGFRDGAGLVLIGLPGIEKRLCRYPQPFSRVGFVHRYWPLGEEAFRFVLTLK